jgi:hypothetical protein
MKQRGKLLADPDRPQTKIQLRMRIACVITKATDPHSEHVILTAFPQYQWLRSRAPQSYIYS